MKKTMALSNIDSTKRKRLLFKSRRNCDSVKIMHASKGNDKLSAFWNLLKILGINSSYRVRNYNIFPGNTQLISFIFLSVSVCCYFSIVVKNVIRVAWGTFALSTSVLYTTLAICKYFCLVVKNDKIKLLRRVIHSFPVERKSGLLWLLLYGMISLSVTRIAVMPYAYLNFASDQIGFFTMDCFEDQRLNTASIIVTANLFMVVEEIVPTFLNCVFCALCYQWVMIISSVKDEVRSRRGEFLNDNSQTDSKTNLLEKCLNLWRITDIMKEAFSSFLFFSIMRQALIIFFVSAVFLVGSDIPLVLVDAVTIIGNNIFHLILTVFIVSKIPDEMEEIVKTMTNIHEEIVLKNRHVKYVSVDNWMKLVMKKRPICLSVGGFADIKKSFIFVIFGSLLTYGLIAIDRLKT